MANFNDIKHEIDQNVNTNGVQAITGAILNETLKDMIDEVDEKKQDTLVAGSGISINGNVISATGGGGGQEYYAGHGINIDSGNNISVDASDLAGSGLEVDEFGALKTDPSLVQGKLTAGANITISGNTISATDTTYSAGDGIAIDANTNEISARVGLGLTTNSYGFIVPDTSVLQEKLTAGDGLEIDGNNEISVKAGSGLGFDANGYLVNTGGGGGGATYSAGQGIDIDSNNVISAKTGPGLLVDPVSNNIELDRSALNFLPLEGGILQNTTPLNDTTLTVMDGMNEDYVRIVAPENAGEAPHVEIFENGSGDTKFYYDHLERGSQTTINYPTISGTLALTSDIPYAPVYSAGNGIDITNNTISVDASDLDGSGLQYNPQTGELDVDTSVIQEKLTAGQNITISGNVISASGGSGGNYLPLDGGALQDTTGRDNTSLHLSAPNGSPAASINQMSSNYGYGNITIGAAQTDQTVIQNDLVQVRNATSGKSLEITSEGFSDGSVYHASLPTLTQDEIIATQSDVNTAVSGKQDTLTAGSGISIVNNVISATGGGSSYSAGTGIDITNNTISVDATDLDGTGLTTNQNGELEVDTNVIQGKLTAGSGISIQNNVISATGGGSGLWTSGTGTGSVMSPGAFQANGNNSVSAGDYTRSNGTSSIALGTSTTTTGLSSAAIGANSTAAGSYSVALGHGLGAVNTDETALGKFNNYIDTGTTAEKTFFTVGNGTSNNTKSNVLEVKQNNDIYVSGVGGFDGTNASSADTLQDVIAGKQDTLVAGANITIQGNVISATGGSGGSYSAGQGIDITNNTISVDNTIATVSDLGGYLPLTGGQLKANPSDAETLLDVAAPDSTSAISMSADTIDSKLAISADKANAGISDGDTFRTVFTNTGEIQVAAKTVNPQDPTDIGETTYTLVLPQKNDTIATLSDIQGGGSSYTAGAGINIDANNEISSKTFINGTGNNSIKAVNASTASGANSVAIGDHASSTSSGCITLGDWTTASGNSSVAIGRNASVNGQNSASLGHYASASGTSAVAIGHYAQTLHSDEIALGIANKSTGTGTSDQTTHFTVGNGTGINARSNAIELKDNSDLYIYGIGGFDGTNAGTSGVETLQQAIANAGGGGTSYTAGQAIDITNGAISVDYGSGLGLGTNGELQVEWSEGPTALAGSGLSANTQNGQLDVDFTSVQGKLTAGSGITISGNTISATGGGGGGSLWTSGTGQNSLVSPGAGASSQGSDASGIGAIVIGEDSNANGDYSFVHGQGSMANGDYSAAFVSSNSTGDYSFAAGTGADAQALSSVAIGSSATTVFDNSDPNAPINAEGSVAICGTTYGMNAVAIGSGSAARGEYSVALGNSSEASGVGSFAQGYASHANGLYSSAFAGSTASANYSFAASTGQAYAHYSTAVSGAEAFGEGAFAAGQGNQAYGYGAAALGFMAQTYSQADGTDVSDPNAGEVALGRYNYSEQGIVFTVGCGYLDETDPDNPQEVRQNAVAIDSTGKIFLKGLGGYTGTSTSGCTDLVSFLNNL